MVLFLSQVSGKTHQRSHLSLKFSLKILNYRYNFFLDSCKIPQIFKLCSSSGFSISCKFGTFIFCQFHLNCQFHINHLMYCHKLVHNIILMLLNVCRIYSEVSFFISPFLLLNFANLFIINHSFKEILGLQKSYIRKCSLISASIFIIFPSLFVFNLLLFFQIS